MRKNLIGSLFLVFLSGHAWGYGTGALVFPREKGDFLLSVEAMGILNKGDGFGAQFRTFYQVSEDLSLSGGMGFSSGERENRFFISADYTIFPDYQKQPRISLNLTWENAEEFDTRNNRISIAPVFSKGLKFKTTSFYPYISFPMGIMLNTDSKRYESYMDLNIGLNVEVMRREKSSLLVNSELGIGLNDSFNVISVGLGYRF